MNRKKKNYVSLDSVANKIPRKMIIYIFSFWMRRRINASKEELMPHSSFKEEEKLTNTFYISKKYTRKRTQRTRRNVGRQKDFRETSQRTTSRSFFINNLAVISTTLYEINNRQGPIMLGLCIENLGHSPFDRELY